jgi:hypothetical protein
LGVTFKEASMAASVRIGPMARKLTALEVTMLRAACQTTAEQRFVDRTLAPMMWRPDWVIAAQAEVQCPRDIAQYRRVDFALSRPERSIAIEVDGPKPLGQTWFRHNRLVAAGYEVVRFTNDQTNDPQACQETLRDVLARGAPHRRRIRAPVMVLGIVPAAVAGWLLLSDAPCGDDAQDWTQASAGPGVVTVRGPVTGISFRPDVNGQPLFIDLGESFPDPDRLSVVAFGATDSDVEAVEDRLDIGDTACVVGSIELVDGVRRMDVEDLEAITTP